MLITFKSPAAGDVLMLGPNGQQMLTILGKDAKAARGIVTVEQLPAAIAALDAAAAEDRSRANRNADADDEAPRGMAAAVTLGQRIAPLLELMKYALRDANPVTWEAS